jgi:hypothetical protein
MWSFSVIWEFVVNEHRLHDNLFFVPRCTKDT